MNLPANAVPLYRILSEKSKIGFGKYEDLTVGDVLKIKPDYIVWLYATYSKISLSKGIIEKLGIRTIQKPGVDESIIQEYKKKERAKYTSEQAMHGWIKICTRNKNKRIAAMIDAQRGAYRSKSILQAYNHGKMSK